MVSIEARKKAVRAAERDVQLFHDNVAYEDLARAKSRLEEAIRVAMDAGTYREIQA